MLPVKSILHPTDFSRHAEPAFWVACALARDYGARLHVLHVGLRPVVVPAEGVFPPDPERYEEGLHEQLCRLQSEVADVTLEPHLLLSDDPAAEILRAAEESHCDLIVMGTHGRTGLGRLLLGSVAEQVVRRAECPVLTVKLPRMVEARPREDMPQEEVAAHWVPIP